MNKIKEIFMEQGYYVAKSLVSKKMISAIFNQVENLIDEALELKKINPNNFDNIDDKYMFLKKNYPKIKSHVYELIKYLDGVHTLSTMSSLLNIIKKLSGPSLLIDGIQLGIYDCENQNLIPIHQEMKNSFSYRSVTAWIPLVDVNIENSTLAYVPNSHKIGYVKHKELNGYPAVAEKIDQSKLEYASLNKGDGFFFHQHLMHGSSANLGSEIRWTFTCRYCPIFEIPYLEEDISSIRIPYNFD